VKIILRYLLCAGDGDYFIYYCFLLCDVTAYCAEDCCDGDEG
jgi:hypothetical protein